MDKSHRVCQNVGGTWDPKKGFALETSSHKFDMAREGGDDWVEEG